MRVHFLSSGRPIPAIFLAPPSGLWTHFSDHPPEGPQESWPPRCTHCLPVGQIPRSKSVELVEAGPKLAGRLRSNFGLSSRELGQLWPDFVLSHRGQLLREKREFWPLRATADRLRGTVGLISSEFDRFSQSWPNLTNCDQHWSPEVGRARPAVDQRWSIWAHFCRFRPTLGAHCPLLAEVAHFFAFGKGPRQPNTGWAWAI